MSLVDENTRPTNDGMLICLHLVTGIGGSFVKLTRSGFILYVQRYKECVDFYRDIVGLERMFSTADLTCFAFGNSYLMIEIDGKTAECKPAGNLSSCLRMNVSNVRAEANRLVDLGVKVDHQEYSWGTVAKFFDPDGNLCALRDDESD